MDKFISVEIMRSPWNWALVWFAAIVFFALAGTVNNLKEN